MHRLPKVMVMARAMHAMHAEIRHVAYGDVKRRIRYLTRIGIDLSLPQSLRMVRIRRSKYRITLVASKKKATIQLWKYHVHKEYLSRNPMMKFSILGVPSH